MVLVVVALPACERVPSASAPNPADNRTADGNAARSGPEIRPVDAAGLKDWISGQKGKWVLVDYWATWCAPCVEKLPKVVELEKKYRDRGLTVASLSLDEPDELQAVSDFLAERGVEFPAMIRSMAMGPAFEQFELQEVPTFHLWNPEGDRVATFTGEFDFAELLALLESKLGK